MVIHPLYWTIDQVSGWRFKLMTLRLFGSSDPIVAGYKKGRLNFRVSQRQQLLVEKAVKAVGGNLSEFCRNAVLEKAEQVLRERGISLAITLPLQSVVAPKGGANG